MNEQPDFEFEPAFLPEPESEVPDQSEAVAAEEEANLLAALHDGPAVEPHAVNFLPEPEAEEPPRFEQPELGLVTGERQELSDLVNEPPSPWERVGLDETSAAEIMASRGLGLEEIEDVDLLVRMCEEHGVSGTDGVRQVADSLVAIYQERERKQAEEERLARLEARLEQQGTQLPGGQNDAIRAEVAQVKEMLATQAMEREAWAIAEKETQAERIAHAGALGLLAQTVKATGGTPPDGDEVAAWYQEHEALNLPAHVAAKLCFESLGVQVTARPDRRRESRVTSSRIVTGRHPATIPGASSGYGAVPDLLDLLRA